MALAITDKTIPESKFHKKRKANEIYNPLKNAQIQSTLPSKPEHNSKEKLVPQSKTDIPNHIVPEFDVNTLDFDILDDQFNNPNQNTSALNSQNIEHTTIIMIEDIAKALSGKINSEINTKEAIINYLIASSNDQRKNLTDQLNFFKYLNLPISEENKLPFSYRTEKMESYIFETKFVNYQTVHHHYEAAESVNLLVREIGTNNNRLAIAIKDYHYNFKNNTVTLKEIDIYEKRDLDKINILPAVNSSSYNDDLFTYLSQNKIKSKHINYEINTKEWTAFEEIEQCPNIINKLIGKIHTPIDFYETTLLYLINSFKDKTTNKNKRLHFLQNQGLTPTNKLDIDVSIRTEQVGNYIFESRFNHYNTDSTNYEKAKSVILSVTNINNSETSIIIYLENYYYSYYESLITWDNFDISEEINTKKLNITSFDNLLKYAQETELTYTTLDFNKFNTLILLDSENIDPSDIFAITPPEIDLNTITK